MDFVEENASTITRLQEVAASEFPSPSQAHALAKRALKPLFARVREVDPKLADNLPMERMQVTEKDMKKILYLFDRHGDKAYAQLARVAYGYLIMSKNFD